MTVLGLLLMAGLGFAATAIIDHLDEQPVDDTHPQDEQDTSAAPHGSLLDEPETHTTTEDHAVPDDHADHGHTASATHSAPAHHGHGRHHADDHSSKAHHEPTPHQPAHASHGHHQAEHHQTGHHHTGRHGGAHRPVTHTSPSQSDTRAQQAQTVQSPNKVFGGDANDTLHGTNRADLIEGNGGNDLISGRGGNDHLVTYDAGHDTVYGGAGNDSLHGYLVQKQPGDLSYVVEDHQADHLHGGLGKDTLFLGSDDVGTGGHGADSFHVSWDVEHGHPAQITDYNPKQDKIYVEFTSNHADDGMTAIKPEEQTITTEPMSGGAGTSIMINGQEIAHVLGAMHLTAADIGLIHA